jgi:hypothetical protein
LKELPRRWCRCSCSENALSIWEPSTRVRDISMPSIYCTTILTSTTLSPSRTIKRTTSAKISATKYQRRRNLCTRSLRHGGVLAMPAVCAHLCRNGPAWSSPWSDF